MSESPTVVPSPDIDQEPAASIVRIHTAPDNQDGDIEMAIQKPSTINVQPTKDVDTFTGAHIQDQLSVHIPRDSQRLPPVQLSYTNVKFSIDIKKPKGVIEKRQILKGCDGTFNPGKLTAVMGASGAGKTSLLNIVSGNPTAGNLSGQIRLNGTDVFDTPARIRELSAYIQQDDLILATQTVREAITLSARLRLPKSMSDPEKLERVQDVIEMLGLTKCQDTIIGNAFNKGVSGGEKRRVSMALELIKSPSILFLDEPTSGLDTYTAHSIIQLLRDIAHTQGKTIICTIHQPSSEIFHMFDDLVLMADGQIMYHGNAEHVVEYFNERKLVCPENFNPADHLFMRVLYNMDEQLKMITQDMASSNVHHSANEEASMLAADREAANKAAYEAMQVTEAARVASLLKEWTSSSEYTALQHELAHPLTTALPDASVMRAERPGEWVAFQLLSERRWYDLIRDRMKMRMQFGQYLFFAILLGLIFLQIGKGQGSVQDREGCLFFVSVQALFMSFMSNLNTFGPEKLVLMREMESGMYGLPSFFFSRWIVEIPFRVLFPFMYSTILYWMIGFQTSGEKFILFAITLILIDNCGTNMAVMICSVFPEVQQAMSAGPAFILPLMVFSGFYVNLSSLGWWFRWISYLSPVRYGFGAVVKNEMDGLVFNCDLGPHNCIHNGDEAIVRLGIENDPGVGLNMFILLIILGGFLMGAFGFMYKTTKKR